MTDRLVIIEDSVITSLLSNPKLLSDIPSLKSAGAVKNAGSPGCTPCQRKARAKSFNYAHVKRVIANLRGDLLQRLKKELNTDKIRVIFQNEAGKLVQITM